MRSVQVEALEDLLTHEGWKILVADLKEKERIEIEGLVSRTDLEEIRNAQSFIKALRRVLNRPRELIQLGGENANYAEK